MKTNGHNAYPKHALAGQNNGGKTIEQLRQSKRDKFSHKESGMWQMPVSSSRIISFQPHSILSDPGTRRSVTALTFSNGKPRYAHTKTGAIIALKP